MQCSEIAPQPISDILGNGNIRHTLPHDKALFWFILSLALFMTEDLEFPGVIYSGFNPGHILLIVDFDGVSSAPVP